MHFVIFMYNHIIKIKKFNIIIVICRGLSIFCHKMSWQFTFAPAFRPIPGKQRHAARRRKRHAFCRQMQISDAYYRDCRQRPCGGGCKTRLHISIVFSQKPQNPTCFSVKKPLGRSECDQTGGRYFKKAGQMTNSGDRRLSR